jgi:ketosteroid isomerase-like protein
MHRALISLLLVPLACAPRPDLERERAAILATDSAWLAAAHGGSIDSTLSFWTSDARVIGPGQAPYVGHGAIRQMLEQGFATPGFSVTWHTTEVVVAPSGDAAYSFGTNAFTMPGAAGRLDTLRGQGVVFWRKDAAGRWRAAVDIWTPLPPGPPAGR